MRYRSKPQEVDAIQWRGDNLEEIESFGVKFRYAARWNDPLTIKAGKDGAQGYIPVPVGHWIVRNVGEASHHWPVDPDYFANKYETAEDRTEPDRNEEPDDEPLLGLATTAQLLEEIWARLEVDGQLYYRTVNPRHDPAESRLSPT